MSKSGSHPRVALHSYWDRTQWPLQSLYFLIPLLVAYELATIFYTTGEGTRLPPIVAESLLGRFFEMFGVGGVYLPGVIVCVVLFCWHLARRDPWEPELTLYALMWVESIVLAVPLFVFMLVLFREPTAAPIPAAAVDYAAAIPLASPAGGEAWWSGLVFSVGAGIYEELLFRLIAIAILHMILVDVLALPDAWGATGAVLLSAAAFALYHFEPIWSFGRFVDSFSAGRFAFYMVAGVYFAAIYVLRGFGIVAATHALYDVLVVVTPFVEPQPR